MHIRIESAVDVAAIRAVNLAAFETAVEADLVTALRAQATPLISMVAEDGTAIVGHIVFSPAALDSDPAVRIAGLAPMAVIPSRQRQGIGSLLVRHGLEHCRRAGFSACIVLGHADYYPRFGFTPASRFGLRSEYEVPDDVFMAMELVPAALARASGTVRYHPAFAGL
jgi:putative acetyltransferase